MARQSKYPWLLAALALGLAVLVGSRLAGRPGELPGTPDVTTDIATPGHPGPASAPAKSTPSRPPLPLPPDDAPVASIAFDLRERADAGDARAACRLGLELLRCRALVQHASAAVFLTESEHRAADSGQLDTANQIAARNLHFMRLASDCRDLPQDLTGLGARYLRQAALAGEPEAMLRYAAGEGFGNPRGFGFLNSPDFDTWRREAPAILRQAFVQGHPEAAHLLRDALENDRSPLNALVPDDPVQARAYFFLILRLQGAGGPSLPGTHPQPRLERDEMQTALDLSKRWHREHFDGRRIADGRSMDRIMPLYEPFGGRANPRPKPGFCRAGEHDG